MRMSMDAMFTLELLLVVVLIIIIDISIPPYIDPLLPTLPGQGDVLHRWLGRPGYRRTVCP